MARPLEGRIALVTGASRGIGAAIAERLARDGADVAVHYGSHRQSAEDLAVRCMREYGVQALAFQADLADLSDAGGAVALFASVSATLGTPHILVNNAGTGRFAPVAEINAQELAQVLAVNAATPLLMAREAARAMKIGRAHV